MYNELVKKISEASPFQPMGRDEMSKIPTQPKLFDVTFSYELLGVEALTSMGAEKEALELFRQEVEDRKERMGNNWLRMFKREARHSLEEAKSPFQPMGKDEKNAIRMDKSTVIGHLEFILRHIDESEVQYAENEDEVAYWEEVKEAVSTAIDYLGESNV